MIDEPEYDPLRGQQRVFTTQLILCLWIGISSFSLFCLLRYKWPHIYAIRTLRKSNSLMRILPNNYFGWVLVVIDMTDEEVLQYSGLDAYVFLMFFKLGIKIFFQFSVLAVLVLSPVRYYYTGHYDKDEIPWVASAMEFTGYKFPLAKAVISDDDDLPIPDFGDDFPQFLWVYPVFAYIFSVLCYFHIHDYTKRVIKARQKYLASQDSITDRTIKIDGLPKLLLKQKTTDVLKDFVEDLGIGKVEEIKMIYDCQPLDQKIAQRKKMIKKVERYIARKFKLQINIYQGDLPTVKILKQVNLQDTKFLTYMGRLKALDEEIKSIQENYREHFNNNLILHDDPIFKQLPCAFVTMDSVASAQMAAQTVLDPRVYKLMVNLAPAPTDIKWGNLKLTYYEKLFKSYFITFIIILSYFPILFIVTSLSTLLDLKSISKIWPELGEIIKKSNWLTTIVTGILPPLLYSLLNLTLPYFYRFLSQHQGYASNSDVELSTLLKNFFYIFFNFFLVFIITGTIWDYFSFIRDTAKIPYQLASSLKKKSLFYIDLILLQGLGMFPIRLLQFGDVVFLNIFGKILFLKDLILKTPRDYRFYYFTPPVFDFGIQLPQHILIFIIIVIYSVVSTKIVTSGLVYFILGYLVYKYQLVYNYVHPPHSTGKVWPIIFRRLMLGLTLFQLFMFGTLALEGALLLSILILPLLAVTLIMSYNYEKYYLPLNNFIALRAIQSPYEFDKEFEDDVSSHDIMGLAHGMSLINDFTVDNLNLHQHQVDISDQSSNVGSGHHTPTINESSMLVNGDYSVDYETIPNSNLRKRRISTIDEEREQFLNYTYPNLTVDLDGPWLEFVGDNVTMIDNDLNVQNKNLIVSEWE